MGLVDTLTRAGVRVPEEVSVVGFDDSQIARLSQIGLTSIRQDIQGIAQGAVRTAIQRLDDAQAPPRELVLDPKLIVRETTRPPC
jgi:DNA-binding LacI/PurR family transcriptional regulator